MEQADIFIRTLQTLLGREEAETSRKPCLGGPQKGELLRVLLPVSKTGERVLTDVAWSAFTPGLELIHLHSTVILKVGKGADALRSAAALWNESCPVGFFNVNTAGSFTHRYTLPVPAGTDGAALAERVMGLLRVIAALLAQYYPEAAALSWPEDGGR